MNGAPPSAAAQPGRAQRKPGVRAAPVAGAALLAAALLFRGLLEATMLGHMMAQLPLIFAGGWLLAGRAARDSERLADCDRHGLAGLTALLFISACWMIPRALELSLGEPLAELAKFASVALLGAVLPASIARANVVIQLFYLGNFSAMTAIAGMLYQDMPEQLCNAYLQDDQARTGAFLITAAVAAAVGWCIRTFPAIRD